MTLVLETLEISDGQFNRFSDMVKSVCGINLHDGKKQLVKARLSKLLRQLGTMDLDAYMEHLPADPNTPQWRQMLDAISTNLTYFFREIHHFEYLKQEALPEIARRNRDRRKLRIWSAGCSSGEEPYTMSIVINECGKLLQDWDVGILATDLSTRVLTKAREGLYGPDRFREMPRQYLSAYFTVAQTKPERLHRVNDAVRKPITFGRLNLMDPWPMKGPFDIIFCRNVMIYFDKQTQAKLIRRYHDILCPGGLFFVGHSESLSGIDHSFSYVQPAIYRRA